MIALVGFDNAHTTALANALARVGQSVVVIYSETNSFSTSSTDWPTVDWNAITRALKAPPPEEPLQAGPIFPYPKHRIEPLPVSHISVRRRYPIRQPCWRAGRWKSKT